MGTLIDTLNKNQVDNMRQLISDLKSGRWQQIIGCLKDKEGGCCIQGAIYDFDLEVQWMPFHWGSREGYKPLNSDQTLVSYPKIGLPYHGFFDGNEVDEFCRKTNKELPAWSNNPIELNNNKEFSFTDFAEFFEYCLRNHPKVIENNW